MPPEPRQALGEEDLPPFYVEADAASMAAQQRFLRQFHAQLTLLVIAALAGALTVRGSTGPDWAGVIAAAAFGCTIVSRLYTGTQGYEKTWYDGRAAAESAKTLGWRFAVGGDPFPITMTVSEARKVLVSRLAELTDALKFVDVIPNRADDEVSPAMLELRTRRVEERISSYKHGRLEDQQAWYANKAQINAAAARRWLRLMFAAEALGLLMGLLKASGLVGIDFLGVAAAASAAVGAWIQVKQYRNLASAYSVTSRELRQVLTSMDAAMDEEGWARFVDEAEEAISREHTMWIASRQRPRAM